MEHYTMNLTLKVWRQKNSKDKGSFETYPVSGISSEMSFLEMFDVLNERLVSEGAGKFAEKTLAIDGYGVAKYSRSCLAS